MGEQIKLARLRRKLPAELIAERAGVSRTTLWGIEKGASSISIGSYTGHTDWGELAENVSSYYHIVTGHQMLELTAIGEKIFCCYQQVIRTDKYIHAFLKVLDEMKLPYQIEGPLKKNWLIMR